MFLKLKEHWFLVLLLVVACILIIKNFFMPNFNYKKAIKLTELGQYAEAFEIFASLGDYKDSLKQVEAIKNSHSVDLLKIISTGNIVSFGSYEQDNNISNGPEDIEWIVLTRDGDRALLISKHALYCIKDVKEEYPWETSDLRVWLNKIFLNDAFNVTEQLCIPTVKITMEKNTEYHFSIYGHSDPELGNNTYDKIFCLSISEVKQYFIFNPDAECKPTAYAIAQGCSTNEDNGNCIWWLRTYGSYHPKAATVKYNGGIDYGGHNNYTGIGIRPALWVELGSH